MKLIALAWLLLVAPAAAQPRLGWSAEAFASARSQGKPVLLVLDHAACGESPISADEREKLEKEYVVVRVDRAARPDVVDLYATAASLLGDPDREPLLRGADAIVLDADANPSRVLHAGGDTAPQPPVMEALLRSQRSESPQRPLARDVVDLAIGHLASDPTTPGALGLLLADGSAAARTRVQRALDALVAGAAHDRTGGGFWEEPGRPAKTLEHNAWLLRVGIGSAHPAALAQDVSALLAGQMREPDGAFRACAGSADPRVVAAWNGIAISALARSGSSLGRDSDLALARAAALAVLARLGPASRLRRCAEAGCGPATLEDFALLATGLLDLHEAGAEAVFKERALELAELAITRFWDPVNGGFYRTDAEHGLIVRLRSGYDDQGPSGNAVMASLLWRLADVTGEARFRDLARRTLDAFRGDLQRAPGGMESLAAVVAQTLERPAPPHAPDLAPARVVLGPVTLEVTLAAAQARAGQTLEAAVRLSLQAGASAAAHEAGSRDLTGFSFSVTSGAAVLRAPVYPRGTRSQPGWSREPVYLYDSALTLPVPVRLADDMPIGPARVRFRLRVQACDGHSCLDPQSVVLDAPIEIVPEH